MSDEVAGHLRAAIMSGTLLPGTFIRLDETAAALGVSITPVREALRTLRGEGMVLLEPHRGHVVAPLSRRDVDDIFWLQATIAKELAATAAERITEEEIAELGRLTDELAATVSAGEAEAIAAAEFRFHRCLNRTTGRIKLAWFLVHVARYMPPLIYASDPDWGVEAVVNHRELVAALKRRDVDEVVRLTGWQFTDGARRLTERLEETGMWD
ncbi:GntR family transcriptional regulator [Mycobacterium sp. 1274761.0]|uniref:GntR family transcriptional regulator n=1 Tax=Mycobacterium sp. 1274761.0 TaxID=1834077 RepID=UPI0008021EEF|nr:GntR family transcriptional regulator [Mycobacterium sp. 1274761.0]OBK76471.1 GntR family transcriptional regulator [Mycobacterium sp. 1274761.0]